MSVRLVIGVRKRLVDITDDDIARMLTHHARQFLRLPDALRDAEAAHDAEQRKIRLRHKAELVAVFVDLILHRPLRQTQKIHVAEFGQQNIVDQLRKIAAQHVLLLKAHRIGPAQTDGAAIEIEHPLALRTFCVLRKAAHTELRARRSVHVPFTRTAAWSWYKYGVSRSHSFAFGRSNLSLYRFFPCLSGMGMPFPSSDLTAASVRLSPMPTKRVVSGVKRWSSKTVSGKFCP